MNENSKTINIFKEFICHVDILSVFLTSEEFPENRELIQNEINTYLTDIVKLFHCMLTSTDKIYEEVFKRNKLLNPQELRLFLERIFYCKY
jgi:2'-5' RNA ligase